MATTAKYSAMPRLANAQINILLIPIAFGLAATGETFATILGMLLITFLKVMKDTACRIQDDTIAAREQAAKAEYMASYDQLTGLANRRQFEEALSAWLKASDFISILYLDLDGFKDVNDAHGHPVGDELLVQVAGRLKAVADPEDSLVSRFGGDEFVILTRSDAVKLANKCLEAFKTPFDLSAATLLIEASIGINSSAMSKDPVELLKNGDIALYSAKKIKHAAYAVFDSAMAEDVERKLLFQGRLRRAIANNEITLHYQPIIDLKSGEIVSAEALARWTDDVLGVVQPDIFIAATEDMGLIDELGGQLLSKACLAAVGWDEHLRVAVNVSPLQFRNPKRLIEDIKKALALSRLPGCRLCIEITEGTMIDDFKGVSATMEEIRALGVTLALDDFGSGYCSLAYLNRIPFDKIKIDRSMMTAAIESKPQQIVIEMVTRIANELDAQVVVEGVENQAEVFKMLSLGVHQAQGYLFGRPAGANDARYRMRQAGKPLQVA
jgi:diguanylate cyclase (GGDEF)-like protein